MAQSMNGLQALEEENTLLSSRVDIGALLGLDADHRRGIMDPVILSISRVFDVAKTYDSLRADNHDEVTPTSETSDDKFFCSANLRIASLVKGPDIPSTSPV